MREQPKGYESTQRYRIEQNVKFWVKSAREHGCDDPHHSAQGCPGPFRPDSFFEHTEFAHYAQYANRITGRKERILPVCMKHSEERFQQLFTRGRIKWRVCHKEETRKERGNCCTNAASGMGF